MGRLQNIITPLHTCTKRDYLARMNDDKVNCMVVAKRYDENFWDGDRRFGYGGYRYDGRWEPVAAQLIKSYNLPKDARILDVGCGKGYLLYEFHKLLPAAEIRGFDISGYAIGQSKEEIKEALFIQKAEEPYPYENSYFDLVISLGTLHNLTVFALKDAFREIERVGRQKFIMVESYRNDQELFNLQCWALTCESFFLPEEWRWLFKEFGYSGDYEFIYFE